jgi:hypothetical protein
MEKLINASPPTTWRPGVVGAVEPSKGSLANVKTAAPAVAGTMSSATVRHRTRARIMHLT